MRIVKLKEDIDFAILVDYGFIKDPANCEEGDTYYHLNNYYLQLGDFRITVSLLDKSVDILCLAKETCLYNIFNLEPLYKFLTSGFVEVK